MWQPLRWGHMKPPPGVGPLAGFPPDGPTVLLFSCDQSRSSLVGQGPVPFEPQQGPALTSPGPWLRAGSGLLYKGRVR